MICFLLSEVKFKKLISSRLELSNIEHRFLSLKNKSALDIIYKPNVTAVVADERHSHFHPEAWIDLLNNLGRRIPVIIISKNNKASHRDHFHRADRVRWLIHPTHNDLIDALISCGAIVGGGKLVSKELVPILNEQIPISMLKTIGALSMLTIDASKFRSVAMKYGSEVHLQLQTCFQKLLYEAWGSPGHFRNRDILCRKSTDSDIYYIFLEKARGSSQIPMPGALERLTDRLVSKIQNKLWEEISAPKKNKMLPPCLDTVPNFSVGHSTLLYNPCIEINSSIETLFEKSRKMATVQLVRIESTQQQMLQTLIRTDGLLYPNYQGIFYAKDIRRETVEGCDGGKDIRPLKSQIFAFESLIRVRQKQAERVFGPQENQMHLNPKYLRPDVLFSLAASCKLSLELDQSCLKMAAKEFDGFPFHLMVNVLPRNIYHIGFLRKIFQKGSKVTFELSETEDINNFELLLRVREQLKELKFGIAADDFGKGYASLDRILKIKPDIIKLDRSLVDGIDKDPSKKAFVEGLIKATKISKSLILGEGIERWEEFDILMKLGVDLVQGFLFHKPQSIHEIKKAKLLETNSGLHVA